MKSKKRRPHCCSEIAPPDVHRPFERLKALMTDKGFSPAERKVEEEKVADEISDEELFSHAMRDVREIPEFRTLVFRQKRLMPSYRRETDREAVRLLDDIVRGKKAIDLSNTGEYLEWVNPDCGAADARALHEGRFSVQDFLDLHGFSLQEAEAEVNIFIKSAIMRGLRCVKIIHGRGLRSPRGPVLKNALSQWLTGRYRRHIIAFVTARQCEGGLGAVFVLLKKG
ncbi:MAG: hypothetical protein HGA78_02790 [Nitrospirales bacterium]|nr:hypothetical protein [Nitrospirales bacterium]